MEIDKQDGLRYLGSHISGITRAISFKFICKIWVCKLIEISQLAWEAAIGYLTCHVNNTLVCNHAFSLAADTQQCVLIALNVRCTVGFFMKS